MPDFAPEFLPRDIYLCATDEKGHSTVRCHRVWNASRFIASQQRSAVEAGGKSKVTQITEEQYRSERNPV